MAKENFDRSKPHIKSGTLSQVATVLGAVAQVFTTAPVLWLFAVMSLAGRLSAVRLSEIPGRGKGWSVNTCIHGM